MTTEQFPTGGVQSLARGLQVLRTLIDEGSPLTGTEIARRFGLHQSSISRVLATLAELGYVRKDASGKFVPDYGILTFAPAIPQFPLVVKPRATIEQIAAEHPGFTVHLCLLWRTEIIYLLRTAMNNETITFWGSPFPLHVSCPALRLLLDLPRAQATEILNASKDRLGWERTTPNVPASVPATLNAARKLLEHDVLILDEWYQLGGVGAAIPLSTDENLPVALAITGPTAEVDHATLRLWLHDARRRVEADLA